LTTLLCFKALLEETTLWQSFKELLAIGLGILIMVAIVFLEE
jgi:hypothetical protein